MKKSILNIVAAAALSLAILGCGGGTSDGGSGGKMIIQNQGSDTIVNLAQAWAEKYAEVNPNVSVEVSGGGSGTGIAALINGTVDIANASRSIKPEEIERVKAAHGVEPKEFIVGFDALAVYVHQNNPMEKISIPQLAGIYGENGTTTEWSQLGVNNADCSNGEIIRVSRQNNSGTYHYFRETLLGKKGDFKLGSRDLHGSKDVVELVEKTPCAIGYSGMGYATDHIKMLKVSKEEGGEAFAPSVANALSGDYPVARPLYLYTIGEPTPEVKAYIDWAMSAAGQAMVSESGYVPLQAGGGDGSSGD